MIQPAELTWRDGEPYSSRYQDIYHSPDGPAEVHRVFLQPAGIDSLLDRTSLLVGELGFGTGLNFAVLAQACLKQRVRLHFVSFEASPLALDDFARLGARRAKTHPVYRELTSQYPPLLEGWHQRILADGLIRLSVFWGEADAGLRQIAKEQKTPFDLWLLDGFAPDRNPDLWSDALFESIAGVCREGTSVTTFSAAGRVRRALQSAGFEMRRVDQRPHKRESLAGRYTPPGLRHTPVSRINVVGAGIAGASTARHLAEAGLEVNVFEASQPGAGASSIPVTVMHGRLLTDGSATADLRAHSYLYSAHYCKRLSIQVPAAVQRTGALQIPSPNYPAARMSEVAERYAATGRWLQLLTAAQSRRLTGFDPGSETLFFPDTCTIYTPALCNWLLDHPGIELTNLNRTDRWPDAPTILACGAACRQFPGAEYLELAEVSGQLNLVKATAGALSTLTVAVVGNGYIAPFPDQPGTFGAGATYEYTPWSEEKATAANLANLDQKNAGSYARISSVKAVRSVSSDRAPVAGSLHDKALTALPDRYVTTGHGSMGTVSSHFCAALLTAEVLGEFLPATPELQAGVSPARFRVRQARRGYRFGAIN